MADPSPHHPNIYISLSDLLGEVFDLLQEFQENYEIELTKDQPIYVRKLLEYNACFLFELPKLLEQDALCEADRYENRSNSKPSLQKKDYWVNYSYYNAIGQADCWRTSFHLFRLARNLEQLTQILDHRDDYHLSENKTIQMQISERAHDLSGQVLAFAWMIGVLTPMRQIYALLEQLEPVPPGGRHHPGTVADRVKTLKFDVSEFIDDIENYVETLADPICHYALKTFSEQDPQQVNALLAHADNLHHVFCGIIFNHYQRQVNESPPLAAVLNDIKATMENATSQWRFRAARIIEPTPMPDIIRNAFQPPGAGGPV